MPATYESQMSITTTADGTVKRTVRRRYYQPPLGGLLSAGHGPDAADPSPVAASGPSLNRENEAFREVERADGGATGGPTEIPVALCRASPTARPVKPGHVLVLAESIKEIGLRQPINVRAIEGGYEIRGGGHRHAAFVMLERETIPAIITDDNDLRAELAEIDENLIRNEYSPAERAIAIARRKSIYETLHPETAHGGNRKSSRQIGDLKEDDEAGEEVADRFTEATAESTGRSERSVQRDAHRGEAVGSDTLQRVIGTALDKGEEIDALAKLSPERREEVIAKAEAGEKVSAKVAVKQERRDDREVDLADKITAMPTKRYGVVLADPEWRFEPWSRDTGLDRAADNHYPTSCTEVIAARDVSSIAAPDCVLFLWATAPMLPHALLVMEAWGFEYRSNFVWGKDRIGTGYWNRNKHEHLLVGVKGDVPAPAMGTQWDSLIEASVGEHSAKPDAFLELIEAYFPNLPKIELNARRARPGWDAWGLEAPEPNEAAEAAE